MMRHIADGADHIYLALGVTDFRKQIPGLASMIALQYQLDPYSGTCVFLFCNRKKNAIRALRWNGNGFICTTKALTDNYHFQWPRTAGELRTITPKQLEWLLSGMMVDPEKILPERIDKSGYVF